jgi:uncharacterized OB-fold protein
MPILDHITRLGDVRAWEGNIPFESLYTAGVAGDRWLRALRDEGRIYGTRCPQCAITYVPARLFCERCFVQLGDEAWTAVGPGGELVSYTVLRVGIDGAPTPPRALGLVRLDGADTLLPHELGALNGRTLQIGLRVRAVFRPERERRASIRDIAYFAPE